MAKKTTSKKQPSIKFQGELKEGQRITVDNIRYKCVGKNKVQSLLDGKTFSVKKK